MESGAGTSIDPWYGIGGRGGRLRQPGGAGGRGGPIQKIAAPSRIRIRTSRCRRVTRRISPSKAPSLHD